MQALEHSTFAELLLIWGLLDLVALQHHVV